jgi:hypothetical protein
MSDAIYLRVQAERCFRLARSPAGLLLADELEALGRAFEEEARGIEGVESQHGPGLKPPEPERRHQQSDLRRLAGAFAALDRNEPAARIRHVNVGRPTPDSRRGSRCGRGGPCGLPSLNTN